MSCMTILFLKLQITRSDIKPHIKWAVSLLIAYGQFNFPQGFMWVQADRMLLTTEAIAFSDSYKHMECLCGMRLQSFLTNGYFVYPCNAGYPS